ncbi:hypothetical protein [Streptomyces sp. AC495_CC817]|uniref:hypothetical protein n=1 Tax=Streptomyces sp. AC495_CC817 TaxID=2823900 RepID=UPI001C25329F|nr:hypothetical protein [Streptomyces sp. AC495_CC817]
MTTSSVPPSGRNGVGRSGVTTLLIVLCAFLALTTIAAAVVLALLTSSAQRPGSGPTPDPSASGTAGPDSRSVQGIDVDIASDLIFGPVTMTATDADGYTTLYAPIGNKGTDEAAEVYFDISTFDADGTLLDRTPSSQYILPEQTTMFTGILVSRISEVQRIRIEQTDVRREAPVITGDVEATEFAGNDDGVVQATLVSSLSAASPDAEVLIVGYLDDAVFGVCTDLLDIPAPGETFQARCTLEPVSASKLPKAITELPDDAEFTAAFVARIPGH